MMQNLLQSNESTDITLVCDDKTKFKAHKFILNACSPVFKTIINDLPEKNSVIYLRGVQAQEMNSILQFMYLGQATLFQDRMNDFLSVAKSLEIKEISKNVDCAVDDSSQDHSYDENIEPNNGETKEEDTIVTPRNDESVVEHKDSKVISQVNEAGQYPCYKCDKQFSYRRSLYQHNKSSHEGIKFSCSKCGYKATTKQTLVIHIQSIHEGLKFPCNMCEYKATQKHHLFRHKKNIH